MGRDEEARGPGEADRHTTVLVDLPPTQGQAEGRVEMGRRGGQPAPKRDGRFIIGCVALAGGVHTCSCE